MANSERRERARLRRAAVDGVAAYLADEDADVLNITNAAVEVDALMAALHLTALAAAAITALAASAGRTPHEALRSIEEAGFGAFSRQPGPAKLAFGFQGTEHDLVE